MQQGLLRTVTRDAPSLRTILAENMRRERLKRGLSQEALADACGLHRTYIGSVERRERNISIDNVQRIAEALEMAPVDLLQEPSGEL